MESAAILELIKTISNEKQIEESKVFTAVEKSIAHATRNQLEYDIDEDISVEFDQEDGTYKTYNLRAVKKEDEGVSLETLTDSQIKSTLIPNVEINRVHLMQIRNSIFQNLREATNQIQYAAMEKNIGKTIKGTIKYKKNTGYVVQDWNKVHFFLPNENILDGDVFKSNERILTVLSTISNENGRNVFILSRRDDVMLEEIMKLEIPEISDGSIQIMGVARNPGFRSKVVAKSNDKRIDCVGACIGIKGMRIQTISNHLCGEKIDVIAWDPDIAQFIINVLDQATVESIELEEDIKEAMVSVSADTYAQAIGTGGQNVRMASKLTGWKINILTPEEMQEKVESKNNAVVDKLSTELDLDKSIVVTLIKNGLTSVEDIANIENEKEIERLIKEIPQINEIISKATEILLMQAW
jgi:N utilization substance protein A